MMQVMCVHAGMCIREGFAWFAVLAGSAYRRAPAGGFVCDVSVAEKP